MARNDTPGATRLGWALAALALVLTLALGAMGELPLPVAGLLALLALARLA